MAILNIINLASSIFTGIFLHWTALCSDNNFEIRFWIQRYQKHIHLVDSIGPILKLPNSITSFFSLASLSVKDFKKRSLNSFRSINGCL